MVKWLQQQDMEPWAVLKYITGSAYQYDVYCITYLQWEVAKNVLINFTMSVSPHVTDERIFIKFDTEEFYKNLLVCSNFN
jgi:hypothetical protein